MRKNTTDAKTAAESIQDGMTVAMSGYAMAGYPKALVRALTERRAAGDVFSIRLITGANAPWLDEQLSGQNIIASRAPMIANKTLAGQVNRGEVRYIEQQMCRMPRLIRSGSFGKIDVAVVEALELTKDGIIPTTSSGFTKLLLDAADRVIVEINAAQPRTLGALHDIYVPEPGKPIPLTSAGQRIGKNLIRFDTKKISHVVEANISECEEPTPAARNIQASRIAAHLFECLNREYEQEGGVLPPIQLGFGGIADEIARSFSTSGFHDLSFFCGGVTEPVLELLDSGKASCISTGGIKMSKRAEEILGTDGIEKRLILRNGEMMNNAEIVSRLGVISLNTALEIDIYGNVNSSHIAGTSVVNGIGGGANFAQNAALSVIMIPASSKKGAISGIVPMMFHQDICEHDIDVVVTDVGWCDVRGMDDISRARAIIEHCAAYEYRGRLLDYLACAEQAYPGHHPQIPEEAIKWHRRLKETGSML